MFSTLPCLNVVFWWICWKKIFWEKQKFPGKVFSGAKWANTKESREEKQNTRFHVVEHFELSFQTQTVNVNHVSFNRVRSYWHLHGRGEISRNRSEIKNLWILLYFADWQVKEHEISRIGFRPRDHFPVEFVLLFLPLTNRKQF